MSTADDGRPNARSTYRVLGVVVLLLVLVVSLAVFLLVDRGGQSRRDGPARALDPRVVVRTLGATSFGAHEGGPLPAVDPTYRWSDGADRKQWNWPLRRALNIWGGATLVAGAPERIDAVLRLRRPVMYFQDTTGSWSRVPEPRPGRPTLWSSIVEFPGGQWTQGPPFTWEHDAATDTWTVDLRQLSKGSLAHWSWSAYYPRVEVPDDVRAVATVGYARLEGPAASDGHLVMGLSSDTFAGPEDTGTQRNIALQGPRYRAVTPSWRLFGVTTQSSAQLREDPPPVEAP